jgi:hypothetical protein
LSSTNIWALAPALFCAGCDLAGAKAQLFSVALRPD